MRTSNKRQRAGWATITSPLVDGFQDFKSKAIHLSSIWYRKKALGEFDPTSIQHRTLRFRSQLRFAASIPIGTSSAITVFPVEGDWHEMAVTELREDITSSTEYVEKLSQATEASQANDDYGVTVLETLLATNFGRVAASPYSYNQLTDEQRHLIKENVARQNRVELMAKFLNYLPGQPKGPRR